MINLSDAAAQLQEEGLVDVARHAYDILWKACHAGSKAFDPCEGIETRLTC